MNWLTLHLPIAGVDVSTWQLVLIGLTVGVVGGFFGVGGAFMVTPALNVFGFPMAYAIGTDMAHMAGKSIVATIKHRKLGNVDMKLGLIMMVFTAIGIEWGAHLIMLLEKTSHLGCGPVVRIVYIILLFSLGTYMLVEYFVYRRKARAGQKVSDAAISPLARRLHRIRIPPMIRLRVSGVEISFWIIASVATFTGFVAGFLGVGGGFVRMPSLIYLIGCPTAIAVGTDLFEVMFSGAYGAFTYALKGRVEIVAAVIMLTGAAVGAQFGTLATKYVKGLTIRFYFSITMLLAGVSVIFKHLSSDRKAAYERILHSWVTQNHAVTGRDAIREWCGLHKPEVAEWFAAQPDTIRAALADEKFWANLAGYLMLGAACALSAIIVVKMIQGIRHERALQKKAPAAP